MRPRTARERRGAGVGAALAAAALFGTAALTACAGPAEKPPTPSTERTTEPVPEPSAPAAERVRTVATGLEAPWSIAFHGETPLVSERDSARILELDERSKARKVGEIGGVVHGGEAGLLGIAVNAGYLYAYFTAEGENRIERFRLSGEPGSLELGRGEKVLGGIPSASFHDGGRIAFGPDGMLYATAGDAGDTGNAQNRDSLAGKILRMTPDGEVPRDNPFRGSYVYTLGHRNPQGIAWGPDGTMYASEFGQDTWDELNVIEAGRNYGWPVVEGIADRKGYVDPVQQWRPAEASPSGIAVLGGAIYVANLRGERLRAVPLDDLATAREYFAGKLGRIRDAVAAPDGALWILSNNTDGRGDPRRNDDRIIRFDPSVPSD